MMYHMTIAEMLFQNRPGKFNLISTGYFNIDIFVLFSDSNNYDNDNEVIKSGEITIC